MNKKKLLSLIHGDAIHVAPGSKVIPKETFSELLDGQEMLQKVKQDEDRYRMEVAAEVEQQREQGRREGFYEGMKQWVSQIKHLEEEVERVQDEIKKLVVPIAIGAAKKLVGRELESSEDTIVDIVTNALRAVSQHRVVTVLVNPQDLDILEANRDRMKEVFDRLETLSIQPRKDIKEGGCIVETESGIINAELEHQWRLLEKLIATTMRKEGFEAAIPADTTGHEGEHASHETEEEQAEPETPANPDAETEPTE